MSDRKIKKFPHFVSGTPHIQKTRGRTYHHIPQPDPNSEEERTTSTYSSEESQGSSLQLTSTTTTTTTKISNKHMYKCNLCEIAFAENAFLLTHLKNRHRSTVSKALKPQFSCGICPAKFFKNSFLVKHIECHEFAASNGVHFR